MAAIRNGIVQRKVVLRPVNFGQVDQIVPDSRGVDLLVKVTSVELGEEVGQKLDFSEIVVGDATGLVTLQLTAAEALCAQVGSVIEVRNATVKMRKGFIR